MVSFRRAARSDIAVWFGTSFLSKLRRERPKQVEGNSLMFVVWFYLLPTHFRGPSK